MVNCWRTVQTPFQRVAMRLLLDRMAMRLLLDRRISTIVRKPHRQLEQALADQS
jgi:hypothetical protein